MTGLNPDTLRAWERRYQAVIPERKGRSRIYKEEHIQRLLLLKEAVVRGYSIGRIAAMPDSDMRELLRHNEEAERQDPMRHVVGVSESHLLQTLLRAIDSFNPATANEELTRLSLLLTPADLIRQVVLPVMHLAGERWHRRIWSIAQEHLLSALLRNLMGVMVRLAQPREAAPKLLVTTPSGELHEFGILAAAVLAASSGLDVIYLGPNLPADEMVLAAARTGARAVILGLAGADPDSRTSEELNRLAHRMPGAVELWLGGSFGARKRELFHSRFQLLEDFHSLERSLSRLKNGSAMPIPMDGA